MCLRQTRQGSDPGRGRRGRVRELGAAQGHTEAKARSGGEHVDRLPAVKIVVLVKQVPSPQHVRLDPETKRLVREGVPLELNEFDVYAVTEAIRLRDAHGGEVVTMTMGPRRPRTHSG